MKKRDLATRIREQHHKSDLADHEWIDSMSDDAVIRALADTFGGGNKWLPSKNLAAIIKYARDPNHSCLVLKVTKSLREQHASSRSTCL